MLSRESVLELRERYVGREVMLYPSDTDKKYAIITDVNELGWEFTITESRCNVYKKGGTFFLNHSTNVTMKFVEEN